MGIVTSQEVITDGHSRASVMVRAVVLEHRAAKRHRVLTHLA